VKSYDEGFRIPLAPAGSSLISHCAEHVRARLDGRLVPTRFLIIGTEGDEYVCETGVLEDGPAGLDSVFRFVPGAARETSRYTVAMLIPTGIGAEIGGHAGDAGPAARLIGSVCDRLIVHPNVVNASDLNEMPDNALYVEGSVLTRLFMGTIGLRPTRGNRLLCVVEAHPDPNVTDITINMFNGARAACGYHGAGVLVLDQPFTMTPGFSTLSGRATGRLEKLEALIHELERRRGDYDAIAISSRIGIGAAEYRRYLQGGDELPVNPIGGVEANLTHVVSQCLNVPSAHSPQMLVSGSWGSVGRAEPTRAVEPACIAFVQCIFKGLHRSPRIVTDPVEIAGDPDVVRATDVSCVVMPDRCLGLPVMAALERGIQVIAVRDRLNVMRNDLTQLPWRPGQLHFAESYLEAAGLISAFKAGLAPETLRRPLHGAPVTRTR
jgi:hypothetical protein